MRVAWSLMLLVTLLPLAGAQEPNAEADDAADDVAWETMGGETVPALHDTPSVDFERIWLGPDDAETVVLGVDMVAPRPEQDPAFSGTVIDVAYITVAFDVGGLEYRLRLDECRNVVGEAALSRAAADGTGFAFVACVPVEEGDDGTYVVSMPRSALVDGEGLPVGSTSLSGLSGSSRQFVAAASVLATDRVPDQGALTDIAMRVDPWSFGPFRVATPAPMRASNGGPDTIVYALHVQNDGPADDLVLHAENLPSGWTARVPARIHVDGETTAPMVVTILSAHTHGTTETFTLVAQSIRDGSIRGEIRYGVEFLAVPQLAGHHPTLYMHTNIDDDRPLIGIPADAGWLNTLVDDPGEDDEPMPPTGASGGGPRRTYNWGLPLDPALLIGMDFDTGRTGAVHAEFTSDVPHLMATVRADLWHCMPDDANGSTFNGDAWDCRGSWYLLAEGISQEQDMQGGQTAAFDVEMRPEEYADVVPYLPGSNIQLLLTLEATTANPIVSPVDVFLLPGPGRLDLPLLDYHDPIGAEWDVQGVVDLISTTPAVRKANAGQTVWATFDVHARDQDLTVALDVAGLNAHWAAWDPGQISLQAGEGRLVALRVDVPSDAVAGQTAELLLLAEPADGASGDVTKLVVKVVEAPQPEDDKPAFIDAGTRNTTAPGIALALATLAVLARRWT